MKSEKNIQNIKNNIIVIFLLFMILIPIITFPSTNDLAVYYQGGKVAFGEGKIFVDFFDLKQPLFYAFFGILSSIAGKSVFWLRFLEFIIHFGTSILLYFFVKKYFSFKDGLASSIVYSISVIVLNFAVSYHLETLSNPFMILLVYLMLKKDEQIQNNFKKILLMSIGLILGLFAGFKLTYLILLFALFFYDFAFIKLSAKSLLKEYFLIILFLIIGLGVSYSWLLDRDILKGFAQNWSYVNHYTNVNNFSFEFFKTTIKTISHYFGYFYSLIFSFAAFLTVYYFIRTPHSVGNKFNFNQNKVLAISISVFFFLLISIIYERKYFEYHFARLYVSLAILTGNGLIILFDELKTRFKKNDLQGKLYFKIFITFSTLFLLVFSPIPRVFQVWKIPVKYFGESDSYFKYIDYLSDNTSNYYDKLVLSRFINKNVDGSKKILVASSSAYDILFMVKNKVINKFPQRALFLGPLKDSVFHLEFLNELRKCDLFIVQKNDFYRVQTGNDLTAFEELNKDKNILDILNEEFKISMDTKTLILFSRKN